MELHSIVKDLNVIVEIYKSEKMKKENKIIVTFFVFLLSSMFIIPILFPEGDISAQVGFSLSAGIFGAIIIDTYLNLKERSQKKV